MEGNGNYCQSYLYIFRPQVAHLEGRHVSPGGKLVTGDIAVFEDKAANAVLLDAESQIKSGYPTIATSTLVGPRRKRTTVLDDGDGPTDMKFFSELVKPVKYRWKFEKDKLKTLAPSKHGFHQRSHSPTFQRLVNANEKLQHLVGQNVDETCTNQRQNTKTDFFETQSQVTPSNVFRPQVRNIKSEPHSTRNYSLPATREILSVGRYDIRPEIRTIEPVKKEVEEVFFEEDEDDDFDDYSSTRTPTPNPVSPPPPALLPQSQNNKKPSQEFKVNLKKTDSHTELHLFLPQIHDTPSRGATPETPTRKQTVKLPRINDSPAYSKSPEDEKAKLKKRPKVCDNVVKRKKKSLTKIKTDQEEKEIRDRLNDVPTLISLENEKDFHTASMCVFENCPHHQYRKTTKIRQA